MTDLVESGGETGLELIHDAPIPIALMTVATKGELHQLPWEDIQRSMKRFGLCEFRGVAFERLATLLETGIDVEPTNAPFFSTMSLDKAAEYGGLPTVIAALKFSCLADSFRVLDAGNTDEEVRAALEAYPNLLRRDDGTMLCSRFDLEDPRMGAAYEIEYGRWIPGDAREALLAVLIVAEDAHRDDVINRIADAVDVPARSPSPSTATSEADD